MTLPSPCKTRFLLSGASGMLGTALRQALETRQLSIAQLVRGRSASASEIRWAPGSAAPVAAEDRETLEGLSAAIHLGGANISARRWTEAYKRELVNSRVESTRALAALLAGLSRPPQVLLAASACGIYGDRGDEFLDETSRPGAGFLADLCQQWEAATLPAEMAGIRVVHLRLGVVLGPGPGALARMLPAFRWGLGGPLGSGRQWMSWISLADAIAAIVFAAQTPSLSGPINLTAPSPVTNRQFTAALAGVLHRPAFLTAPRFALRAAFGQMADEALLASTRAFPARLTTAGFQFTHPLVDQALTAALGPAESR